MSAIFVYSHWLELGSCFSGPGSCLRKFCHDHFIEWLWLESVECFNDYVSRRHFFFFFYQCFQSVFDLGFATSGSLSVQLSLICPQGAVCGIKSVTYLLKRGKIVWGFLISIWWDSAATTSTSQMCHTFNIKFQTAFIFVSITSCICVALMKHLYFCPVVSGASWTGWLPTTATWIWFRLQLARPYLDCDNMQCRELSTL